MTRRDFMAGGVSLAALSAWPTFGQEEDSRLTAAKKWFVEAQYGMMAHWGLYSLLGGEWKGQRMGQRYIAEWIQQYYVGPDGLGRIPARASEILLAAAGSNVG